MSAFDPDLLRTFVAFAETGALTRAAQAVGRTPSAVTAQMRRLEQACGEALLEPAGRGRALTPAGQAFVGHARRILAAQNEALLSLRGARTAGRVSLGATQDFAQSGLPELLRVFARTHPDVRLDLRVGRSQELAAALAADEIDIGLVLRGGPEADEIAVWREPMIWLAARDGLAGAPREWPLALLDPPCGFRTAALAALEQAGAAYRIAATSQSLSGLRAAVAAGLAVTLRTPRLLDADLVRAGPDLPPPAQEAEFALRLRPQAGPAARSLAELLAQGLVST